ncbi:MAG TPA: ATP-dependent DNA helicase RecG [Ktedonobacterales bacterium]
MSQGPNGARTIAERARKVLLHEQRTGFVDGAVKPGGLEAFIAHWAREVRAARDRDEIGARTTNADGPAPEDAIARLLTGYHDQDPMQRTARVRAALALLDSLSGDAPPARAGSARAPLAGRTPTRTLASAPPPRASTPTFGQSAGHRTSHVSQGDATPWPLASPPPDLANLRAHRALNGALADGPMGDGPMADGAVVGGGVVSHRGPGQAAGHRTQGGATTERAQGPAAPPRPEDEYLLSAPVTAVPNVGRVQEQRLAKLGIRTVRDLLFHFPREHHDYSKLQKIGQIPFGEVATIYGLIWEVENVRGGGRGVVRTIARITDETGSLRAVWFNQPYLQKQLPHGAYIVVTGVKQRFGNRVEFSVRSHELPEVSDLVNTGRLVPVYPLTEGLAPKQLRRFTKWAVDRCAGFLPEHLPVAIRTRARLLPLPEAIAQFHYPENEHMLAEARRRLAFDELFLMQIGMLTRRANWREGPPAPALPAPHGLIFDDEVSAAADPDNHVETIAEPPETTLGGGLWPLTASCFERELPFRFTGAQRRALREVLADMAGTRAMSRLLQGDVGSGKTVVAAAALLAAAANGYQGALLAPTEILAEQHYRGVSALLAPFGLRTVVVTGGQRARERAVARDGLAGGEAAVAVGTHALIQDEIAFKRLGLAVVDEQHRFGVEQRDALRQKGYNPHMLVMTATPIPRTLALTIYGDLDVSTIDELPAGRQPIITRWRHGIHRQEAYEVVAREVAGGRQAYVICPLVEESETIEARAAIKEYERLRTEVFPDLRLGLVHGQLRPAEKDRVMRAFRDGAIDVLVATAVVEVGVDVPNATVMLIEDADRFGLSQLHQFRGRVGRGAHQSYCYLLSQEASAQGAERLGIMESTSDGFALADADLRLRGPGDFFGTRQSGMPELRVAKLADTPLIAEARAQAEWLWERDPYLKQLEHAPLRERVALFWSEFAAH